MWRVRSFVTPKRLAIGVFVVAVLGGAGAAGGEPLRVAVLGPPPSTAAPATPAAVPSGAPTRVRVPAIGVDSPLEALHLDRTGTLEAPADFARPGWYAGGTAPGDTGPAVIAGHIDSKRGPAVFYRLDQLRQGDLIQVQRGGAWLAFHVVSTGRYPKTAFPTAAVYGPTPDAELRLITCGGQFDETRRSYLDNTVVYAVAG